MTKKKTGLGEDPLSWITDTGKAEAEERPKTESKKIRKSRSPGVRKFGTSEVQDFSTSEVPKYKTLDLIYFRLRRDQVEFLEGLTREIMAGRDSSYKKERITKNTILRTLIDILRELDIDKENISDEKELLGRIENAIKQKD